MILHQNEIVIYEQKGDSWMNSAGSNIANVFLYAMTFAGTFLAENWNVVIMLAFGTIHAYVAWRRHKREEDEASYKIKYRKLLIAHDEEQQRIEDEMLKKHQQEVQDRLLADDADKKKESYA